MPAARNGFGGSHGMHGLHGLLMGTAALILLTATFANGAGAVEPTTIPTAASGMAAPRCTVGQPCTFAAPTFACDYAGAERIAKAGPVQGAEIGSSLVREQGCQTIAIGRAVSTETTKSAQVIYVTEGGQHLGYMPVGVFALSGTGARATCDQPGFCAVRPGAQISLCPTVANLALPTPEARSAAKCLHISDSNAGEVNSVAENTVTLVNMFGGKPPYQSIYYAARSDFVRLDLRPYPTAAARGWCRPETWCVTSATALFCTDKAAPARIEATPLGEPRRLAVQAEPSCRFVVGGGVLKPKDLPVIDDAQKLVAVEHPTLGVGWANVSAFPVVAYSPPLRDTARLSDIAISAGRAPSFSAIELRGQGTSAASGVFRAGPSERREFCTSYWGEDQAESSKSCLAEPDATAKAGANCEARRVVVDGRRYELVERPPDAAPDIHTDEHRTMLYRDLKNGEWLDGSSVSGEVTVETAMNALCPGVDPQASFGLVYRDPRAQYPRALWGRWFSDPSACGDPRRNESDFDKYVWTEISGRKDRSRGREDTISTIQQVGRNSWMIGYTMSLNDRSFSLASFTFSLTNRGLEIRPNATKRSDEVSPWVRCPD